MKFKNVKGEEYKALSFSDYSDDVVSVETAIGGDGVYFSINSGLGVHVSKKKVRKLVRALIAEFDI